MNGSYLLVDEILVIVFDIELPLHILDFSPLQEKMSLCRQHLSSRHFSLAHKSNQLTSILQFLPEPPQFVRTLGISTASLANLPNLTPAEADIRICIICILTGFELQMHVSNV